MPNGRRNARNAVDFFNHLKSIRLTVISNMWKKNFVEEISGYIWKTFVSRIGLVNRVNSTNLSVIVTRVIESGNPQFSLIGKFQE